MAKSKSTKAAPKAAPAKAERVTVDVVRKKELKKLQSVYQQHQKLEEESLETMRALAKYGTVSKGWTTRMKVYHQELKKLRNRLPSLKNL